MNTGYQVRYTDFVQLLTYGYYRRVIAPLLKQWFDYEVVPVGENAVVVHDAKGNEVPLEEIHAAIQADPERQGRLYREAMTLWH